MQSSGVHSEFMGSEESKTLTQYAVFFFFIIGLVPVMVFVAFMREQNEDESTDDVTVPSFESSRISWPLSELQYASQPGQGELLWKLGWFNISINLSLLAAICVFDKRLKLWVIESMCWRVLLCFGAAWISLFDFQLAVSNRIRFQMSSAFSTNTMLLER